MSRLRRRRRGRARHCSSRLDLVALVALVAPVAPALGLLMLMVRFCLFGVMRLARLVLMCVPSLAGARRFFLCAVLLPVMGAAVVRRLILSRCAGVLVLPLVGFMICPALQLPLLALGATSHGVFLLVPSPALRCLLTVRRPRRVGLRALNLALRPAGSARL